MKEIWIKVLPYITASIGVGVGFSINVLLAKLNHKQDIIKEIIQEYFVAKEYITDILNRYANLRTKGSFEDVDLKVSAMDISNLYYKYYDILPQKVLNELSCLYACMIDNGNNIYRVKDKKLYVLHNEDEIQHILKYTSLFDNTEYYTYLNLMSSNHSIKRNTTVNIQARIVLQRMNEYFTIRSLIRWVKYLPKMK